MIEEGSCSKTKPDEATFLVEVSEKSPSTADQPSIYVEPVTDDLDEVSIDPAKPNHKVLIGLRLEVD